MFWIRGLFVGFIVQSIFEKCADKFREFRLIFQQNSNNGTDLFGKNLKIQKNNYAAKWFSTPKPIIKSSLCNEHNMFRASIIWFGFAKSDRYLNVHRIVFGFVVFFFLPFVLVHINWCATGVTQKSTERKHYISMA